MPHIIFKPKFDFEILEIGKMNFPEVFATLSHVEEYYPNFRKWLTGTFRSESMLGARKIIIAHSDGALSGLALLKDTFEEKKICTFFVSPDCREKNLGVSLMTKSLAELGEKDISITVAEERHSELKQLLLNCDFRWDKTEKDLYRLGKSEFFYSR